MSYNEIQRLQQLAGIITEIRVRPPGVKRDLPIIINSKEEFIKTAKELTIDGYYWRGINNKPLLVSIPKRYPIELFHDDIDNDYRELTYKTLYPDGRKTRHIKEIKINEPLRKIVFPILIKNEKDWWRFIRNRFTPIYQKNDYNQKEKYLEKFLDDVDQYSFPRKPSFPFYVTNDGISSKLVKKIK